MWCRTLYLKHGNHLSWDNCCSIMWTNINVFSGIAGTAETWTCVGGWAAHVAWTFLFFLVPFHVVNYMLWEQWPVHPSVPTALPLNPNASAHGFTVLSSIINLDSLSLVRLAFQSLQVHTSIFFEKHTLMGIDHFSWGNHFFWIQI